MISGTWWGTSPANAFLHSLSPLGIPMCGPYLDLLIQTTSTSNTARCSMGKTDQSACVFIKTHAMLCIQLHAWHAYIVCTCSLFLPWPCICMHQQVAYCGGVVWCKLSWHTCNEIRDKKDRSEWMNNETKKWSAVIIWKVMLCLWWTRCTYSTYINCGLTWCMILA